MFKLPESGHQSSFTSCNLPMKDRNFFPRSLYSIHLAQIILTFLWQNDHRNHHGMLAKTSNLGESLKGDSQSDVLIVLRMVAFIGGHCKDNFV